MISKILLLLSVSISFLISCGDNAEYSDPNFNGASFTVLSDIHIYDTSLGTEGKAFETYLEKDRKLLLSSVAVLDKAIENIIASDTKFVVITGDLTKDGELICHNLVASKLKKLKDAGKKVYVVPGNHDINNPHAKKFLGDETESISSVTAEEYEKIYYDYGYKDAIYKHDGSLSYIAEPAPGVWLFVIDSNRYEENVFDPITGGVITESVEQWVLAKLSEAKGKGKLILGAQHHGMTEHYAGQSLLFNEYVVEEYGTVGEKLAEEGLNTIFTGHFHANDIAVKEFNFTTVTDIETGSLVTYPCPYRTIEITKDKIMNISTVLIDTVDNFTPPAPYTTFVKYAQATTSIGVFTMAMKRLTSEPFNLPAEDASKVAPLIAQAMLAHYAGDEKIPEETMAYIGGLIADPKTESLGVMILNTWTDHTPDNTASIDLN